MFLLVLLLSFFQLDFAHAHSYKIRIYTAEWCAPCRRLHAELKNNPSIAYRGISLPIDWVDVDDDRYESSAALQSLKQTRYIPEIQLTDGDHRGAFVELFDSDRFPRTVKGITKFFAATLDRKLFVQTNGKMPTPVTPQAPATDRSAFVPVALIGTGGEASHVPYYVPYTIFFLKQKIGFSSATAPLTTFFNYEGEGDFEKANTSFTLNSLQKWKNKVIKESKKSWEDTTSLLVVLGHGSVDSWNTWGGGSMSADELKNFLNPGLGKGLKVVTAGPCYGGSFAHSADCGYFAATPAHLSTGCWDDPNAALESDYLSYFYSDNTKTLEEAHFFAVKNVPSDIPYTTTEAIARSVLKSKEKTEYSGMTQVSYREIESIILKHGSRAEKDFFKNELKDHFTEGHSESDVFNLIDRDSQDKREHLLLVSVARRAWLRSKLQSGQLDVVTQSRVKRTELCDQMTLPQLLRN